MYYGGQVYIKWAYGAVIGCQVVKLSCQFDGFLVQHIEHNEKMDTLCNSLYDANCPKLANMEHSGSARQ